MSSTVATTGETALFLRLHNLEILDKNTLKTLPKNRLL